MSSPRPHAHRCGGGEGARADCEEVEGGSGGGVEGLSHGCTVAYVNARVALQRISILRTGEAESTVPDRLD